MALILLMLIYWFDRVLQLRSAQGTGGQNVPCALGKEFWEASHILSPIPPITHSEKDLPVCLHGVPEPHTPKAKTWGSGCSDWEPPTPIRISGFTIKKTFPTVKCNRLKYIFVKEDILPLRQ